MLKKIPVLNQLRTCIKRVIQKNCASVPSAGNASTNVVKNSSFFEKWKACNFHKYGFTLCAVTTLSSLLYTPADDDVETNLAHLMQLARFALENGELDRAEAILKLGLKLSEEHKLHTALPFIYDILATLAINEGKVEDAEILLVEAIENLSALGYPDNNHNIVDFRLRLARMYSTTGYKSLADIGFENCLDQQKAKILDGDLTDKTGLLYVNILFWYGVHKIRNDLYMEAKQLLRNAYDYSTKIKGLSPKQEMVILYTLSDINAQLGDYEIALTSMLDAIILGKGIGSVDLPLCYLKLGYIYQKLEIKDKARVCFQEAKTQGELFGYGEVVSEAVSALGMLKNKF